MAYIPYNKIPPPPSGPAIKPFDPEDELRKAKQEMLDELKEDIHVLVEAAVERRLKEKA